MHFTLGWKEGPVEAACTPVQSFWMGKKSLVQKSLVEPWKLTPRRWARLIMKKPYHVLKHFFWVAWDFMLIKCYLSCSLLMDLSPLWTNWSSAQNQYKKWTKFRDHIAHLKICSSVQPYSFYAFKSVLIYAGIRESSFVCWRTYRYNRKHRCCNLNFIIGCRCLLFLNG